MEGILVWNVCSVKGHRHKITYCWKFCNILSDAEIISPHENWHFVIYKITTVYNKEIYRESNFLIIIRSQWILQLLDITTITIFSL